MEKKWSRTPKHILRTECIKFATTEWPTGSFVEFGAGTGDITRYFLEAGFHGKCYDLGDENRNILRRNLARYKEQVEVVDDPALLVDETFDYLFAFEVLEHIKNDQDVLAEWTKKLKRNGMLLISVPAHQRKFSEEDDWVGHVRRYEKSELFDLLLQSGYQDIKIFNYGFPLGNITRLVSRALHRHKKAERSSDTPEERSIKSGVERISEANGLSFLSNVLLLKPFIGVQSLFFNRDWGDGYVVTATKRTDNP